MKKTRFVLVLTVLFLLVIFLGQSYARRPIEISYALKDVSISAGGYSVNEEAIDLSWFHASGYFAAQISVSGGGTFKFEVLASGDGKEFKTVDGQSAIKTGVTSTSGPDGDGKLYIPFSIGAPAKFIQIKATETGGSSGGVVTVLLVIATQ
jgi:hypothetical protein